MTSTAISEAAPAAKNMTAIAVAGTFGSIIEWYGARVRFTGASFGFQASAAIGGGFAPIIATWLAAYMGGTADVSPC